MSDLKTLTNALTFWSAGRFITADDIREFLDAAQVPDNARGPLFHLAAEKGYLKRTVNYRRTRHVAGKGHLLRVYMITDKARTEAQGKAA